MLKKNLIWALGFIAFVVAIYKLCFFIGLPLYPFGMAFFLIPILGLIPVYQYYESKQINGYKQHLIASGRFTLEQLDAMTPQEIEMSWRDSRNAS